ncbi:MAG: hypothetical protein KA352_12210 [Flavobacteriales bacterium]|nr:hypothetical protein [Flavobacteriales bacterium]
MRYLVVLCVALSGCAPIYVQMFNTSTAAESQSPEQWVFTQDSVRVFYGFYAERGVMAFAVENLRSTPVYVDWKRSSCVVNGARMNYWTDEVVTKSQAVTSSASISATDLDWYWIRTGTISEGITSNRSVAQRPERIAFVPPHSFVQQVLQHRLYRGDVRPFSKEVKTKSFSSDSSPLSFRNYLTITFDESGAQSMNLDHAFWVSSIDQVRLYQFRGAVLEQGNGNHPTQFEYPLRSHKAFYVKP